VRLRQEGVDPLSVDNGRFFVFKRTGDGFDTQYSVSVYKQNIEVPGLGTVQKDLVHVLSADTISKLGTVDPQTGAVTFDRDGHEITALYARPTAEQVARMVAEGPSAVQEILGRNQAEDSEEAAQPTQAAAVAAAPLSLQTQAPAAQVATVTHANVQAGQPVNALNLPSTSGNAAVTIPTQAPTTVTFGSTAPAAKPAAAVNPAVTQTPEEFLKQMGLG
jgi:hypothetical protein